jgi:hypothetical protein
MSKRTDPDLRQCVWVIALFAVAFCVGRGARADTAANCDAFTTLNSKASAPIGDGGQQGQESGCRTQVKNGYPVPDPGCTPGATNPTLTVDILRDPAFRTTCVRDNATTATQKASTYGSYSVPHPQDNRGVMQTCELDHLVSLELGGADTLDNIWPQCGPSGVVLRERYFKQKDMVENYLAKQVRDGLMKLKDAQDGIAKDWTQYLAAATKACGSGKCR